MADITTVWSVTHGDWVQLGAALESGDDLTTAVLISVFTDATALADDVIPDAPPGAPGDPRGWWGDEGETYAIGSRLWIILARAKQTQAVLTAAQDAIQTCLQWMIADKVVAAVSVVCSFPTRGQFGAIVTLTLPNGAQSAVEFQTAI